MFFSQVRSYPTIKTNYLSHWEVSNQRKCDECNILYHRILLTQHVELWLMHHQSSLHINHVLKLHAFAANINKVIAVYVKSTIRFSLCWKWFYIHAESNIKCIFLNVRFTQNYLQDLFVDWWHHIPTEKQSSQHWEYVMRNMIRCVMDSYCFYGITKTNLSGDV